MRGFNIVSWISLPWISTFCEPPCKFPQTHPSFIHEPCDPCTTWSWPFHVSLHHSGSRSNVGVVDIMSLWPAGLNHQPTTQHTDFLRNFPFPTWSPRLRHLCTMDSPPNPYAAYIVGGIHNIFSIPPRATKLAPLVIFHDPQPKVTTQPSLSSYPIDTNFLFRSGICRTSRNYNTVPFAALTQTSPFPTI